MSNARAPFKYSYFHTRQSWMPSHTSGTVKLAERIAEWQLSPEYPNGYAIPGAGW